MNWHEIFEYDNGVLRWKVAYKKNPIGSIAGIKTINGNIVSFFSKAYKIRRVVWEMFNGEIPPDHCIIHLDGNKYNNKIENLRMIERREQNFRITNKKFIGVYPTNSGYESKIMVDYQPIYLGVFSREENAARAYDKALIKYKRFRSKSNFPLESYDQLA